jgi:5-deoxy-glucuronate isomerase
MTLRVRPHPPDFNGSILEVTPHSAGWSHVGFQVVNLAPGQSFAGGDAGREACLVILTGTADVEIGDHIFPAIGGRTSVFEDAAPAAVYAPAGSPFRVTASTAVELAIGTAPAEPGREPRLIDPASMSREVRGQGTNQRFVRNILPETAPADSLLVVEVITPGGHTSSYPPHRHDEDDLPRQSFLEETYYHRFSKPQGFGFQRVFTDDRSLDESMLIEDGDVVMVPRGYHPVAAVAGYDVYYLNVMAGPKRTWKFYNAPEHEWMLG